MHQKIGPQVASCPWLGPQLSRRRSRSRCRSRPTPTISRRHPCPDKLKVEAGNEVFLVGHGVGTQNYICVPSGTGVAYTLFTPQATLFSDDEKQLTTHFFSPNPF